VHYYTGQPDTPDMPDLPKKVQKKPYAKANITNSADKLIRKELDDADGILEKVILRDSSILFMTYNCNLMYDINDLFISYNTQWLDWYNIISWFASASLANP